LRGTGGEVTIWDMNSNRIVGGGSATQNGTKADLGSYWTIAGTGDFNYDGYTDILWRGAGGEVSIWDMNNNQVIGGGAVTLNGTAANTGTYWEVAGTGDFNHDGYADILLRGAGGESLIWNMNNTQISGKRKSNSLAFRVFPVSYKNSVKTACYSSVSFLALPPISCTVTTR
jgi:hypothetical protein